jgi:hypothetical protein
VASTHQAHSVLSPPDLKYSIPKTLAGGSFVEDACAGSRAECVSLNFKTSPSPETLAPYTRDAIAGYGIVCVTPSMVRDLVEDLFLFMGLNIWLVLEGRFS